MPRLTDEQLDERARGLGATDIATAAGVNPYQSPFELYLSKIGELDVDATIDDAARGRMERGHRLEDVALQWDADERGLRFERVKRTIWHPTIPVIYCHPDARRIPWRTERTLIEVKTSLRRWSDIPRHVEAQCQIQMACTGAEHVEVLVLGFDGPPTSLVVDRDPALISALEELAVAFWDRVQRRDPPPVDGSSGTSRWLDRTRWRNEPDVIANPLQRELVAALVETRARIEALEGRKSELENKIKDSLAGAGRLNAPGIARVNWTAPTTVHSTAWKEVAAAYRKGIEDSLEADEVIDVNGTDSTLHRLTELYERLDTIVSLYTTEREQRTFRVIADRED